jgi:hypothetical protein
MKAYVQKLHTVPFSLHYNPYKRPEFEIRIIGQLGRIDNLPFHETHDVVGYGRTLEEAAREALQKKFGAE